jgi:hypothetical protein
MLYPKNVPNFERAGRIMGGIVLVVLALFGQQMTGISSSLLSIVLVLSAMMLVVTGFVGWCPACAMVGRKLK